MLEKLKNIALKPQTLFIVYMLAAIVAALQFYFQGTHAYYPPAPGTLPPDIMNKPELYNQFAGKQLTEYNNYLIFKWSYFHLLDGKNLYGLYPDCHWDFYKYSPTFSFLMAPMAYLPDAVGLSIWNIINALSLFFAIRTLPITEKKQIYLTWFVALELLTSLQNHQSNGLMAALLIGAYGCLNKGKTGWAALWLVLSVYIKVYGAIGFCMFLFFPKQRVKFVLYSALWFVVLGALPLFVTPLKTLLWQYQNWGILLKADASEATGLSVAGWLSTWFGLNDVKAAVSIAGILLFLAQFINFKNFTNKSYQMLLLASMLLWVVIFNHKAESPTFVIAIAGGAVWYYSSPKATWRTALIVFAFIVTCLGTTDVFPPIVRHTFYYPYKIKVLPCIILWAVVFWETISLKRGANADEIGHEALV